MKSSLIHLFLAFFVFTAAAQTNAPAIIPLPQHMDVREGAFVLWPETKILVNAAAKDTGKFLADRLRASTGYPLPVKVAAHPLGTRTEGTIILECLHCGAWTLGAEGYDLRVSSNSVVILATNQAGLFYGVQTLLQLLPPEILADKVSVGRQWTIPRVTIIDQPRFAWRGLMLDVSRHFFTKTEVEQILDVMPLYKLNMFHMHLVDDQGWRIEIKKYPRLTSVGAWRNEINFTLDPKSSKAWRADGKYGGFYTQKDIRELVRYAAARHITIVPEIEMPGHSAGALSAYPQYSCTGGPFSRDKDDAIFCPGNEETYAFLENILGEVMKLFPGPFVHIGGDEVSTADWKKCPKCQARMKEEGFHDERQLQSYLIQRIEKFVNVHGKRLIGWSEIRKGGLAKNAAVMDWAGGGAEAASAGHDVVMSPYAPDDFAYLNVYQTLNAGSEPAGEGGFLPLSKVYRFEPKPKDLAPQFQPHILGGQGNLWTEYVPNLRQAEYMYFPRACAMAEVLWSPKDLRNWTNFLARVKINEQRLEAKGVNYRRDPLNTGEKHLSQ